MGIGMITIPKNIKNRGLVLCKSMGMGMIPQKNGILGIMYEYWYDTHIQYPNQKLYLIPKNTNRKANRKIIIYTGFVRGILFLVWRKFKHYLKKRCMIA